MEKYTSWTEATLNPFKAVKGLVSCLQSGRNAWIERQENGKQDFPLVENNPDLSDISNWTSSGAYGCRDWEAEKKKIEADAKMHPTAKKLKLEYTTAFGTEKEYQKYLKTGKVKFRGIGKCYFVKYEDLVKTRKEEGTELSSDFRFVLQVSPIPRYKRVVKTKRKVYVVCWNNDKVSLPWWVKTINVLTYPLKFIPKRSVLRMKEYTNYTFRIGDVVNGYQIEIQIPKKFSFK